jgi:hypothetical protein
MRVFIDIETLPGPEKPALEEVKVPSNYKDPAKIRAYQEEKLEEVYRAQALDSMKGQILAIGKAVDDEPAGCHIQGLDGIHSERDLLNRFYEELQAISQNVYERAIYLVNLTWIGHNIKAFDLTWLWRHALKYRLYNLAEIIPRERYSKQIVDTMDLWAADYKDRVSLDNIASFLGLPGKPDGIDGSKVYDLYQAGRLKEIADYCQQDVELTRQIYELITG